MDSEPNPILRRILTGAIAGFAATVPMTLFMVAAKQKLPRRQQYRLPPREIVASIADSLSKMGRSQDDSQMSAVQWR
ncbi:MAG: hypothetical protein EHM41_21135 [Chloroflexi bacterium]|nr:MAG: hypothetical protein EHM41_21135 [Chloroflexota bacterium]